MVSHTDIHDSAVLPAADIDECEDGTDGCNGNADCSNTIGSYTCSCLSGYSGDGTNCNGMQFFNQTSSC